jgi:DNA-binding MarR family transcriptional regulator
MNKRIIDFIFELKSGCSEKEFNIREKLKLSPAEFRGILALNPKNILPCSILAKRMGLSVSRGSRVVEKLMKNGYLKEVKSDGDRRVIKVTLAKKGVKTREKISDMLDECEQSINKKISKAEIETLVISLTKINEVLVSK